MGEGMHARLGRRAIGRGGQEDLPRRAERDEAFPFTDGPHRDCARGGIARACRDGYSGKKAQGLGRVLGQRTRDRVSGAQIGQPGRIGRRCRAKRVGPAPRCLIEPEGPRRIRGIGDALPVQTEPDPVLGQQDMGDPAMGFGLVPGQPHELRRGETRHGPDARDLREARIRRGDFGALRLGPAVIPQDRRTDHRAFGIQKDRAVHLTREADSRYLPRRVGMGGKDRAGGGDDRLPPIGRGLFRPAGLRVRDRQGLRCIAQNAHIRVEQADLDAGCADIDAEKHGAALSCLSGGTCLFGTKKKRPRPGGCRTGPLEATVGAGSAQKAPRDDLRLNLARALEDV